MKKMYVVFVLLLLFSSGCITDIATRKEGDKKDDSSMQDLFNQSLRAQGLGPIDRLNIKSREIDIKKSGWGGVDKVETLKGSDKCIEFEIIISYKDEKLEDFKIKTGKGEGCKREIFK